MAESLVEPPAAAASIDTQVPDRPAGRRSMRLAVAALLGLLIPGTGHLVAGERRLAALLLAPFLLLVAGIVALLLQGGPIALIAFVVIPGVLPALAVVNVLLAGWRVLSGVDAARRVERSPRATGILAVAVVALVLVPHVVLGQVIASTNDFLDSMFASGPAVAMGEPPDAPLIGNPTDGPVLDWSWLFAVPLETDEPTLDPEVTPGVTEVPRAGPTPTAAPRGPYTGGGGGTLPPLGAAVPWQAPGAIPWGDDGRFDLLLLGSDAGADRWSRRMDVMLLVEVDVSTGEIAMIGVPRTLLNAPFPPGPARNAVSCGCLTGLLNELYVEATERHPDRWPGTGAVKGIGAVRSVISELTGRPIDAVVVADLMGVIRVVDAMGGVDINVPSSVYDADYPDPVLGSIVLRIPAGQQHLNGRLSLAYARSRHQDSDYARMLRQQTLLLAIRAGLGPVTILQAPDLVTAAKGAAWTDLPRDSLSALVQLFGKAGGAPVHQLRIVPPTYPEWLTAAEIAQIRRDIGGLLPPVPNPTPAPSPTASPSPSGSVVPSASPGSSPTPAPSATSAPSGSPAPSPTPTPTASSPPPPSPTPSPSPSPTPSPT